MLFLDLTRLQIETDDIHPGNFLAFDDNFANRRCLEEKMAAKRRAAVDGNVRRSDGLLFALFILILSFSDVDSDSFKRDAGPIAEAFNQPKPIVILNKEQSSKSRFEIPQQQPGQKTESTLDEYLKTIAWTSIENLIKSSIPNELLDNIVEDNLIILRFPASSVFTSGSAGLDSKILGALDRITDVLAQTQGKILVSAHSDNTPITTPQYRSNWDLSSTRTVLVVHRLLRHAGLDEKRISATGFASTKPLVENNSPKIKQRNRRVEVTAKIPITR